jgi:hypothetical protein
MNDVQFAGRWDGAIELGLGALMDLRPTVAKLRMIEVCRVIGPYLQSVWESGVYRASFFGRPGTQERELPRILISLGS